MQGAVKGRVWSFRDITTRRKDEGERVQLRFELSHLARVMTMNELSTSLAHEINQPLGAILNNASAAKLLMAQAPDKKDEIDEILADIIMDAKRAGDVVRKTRGIVKKDTVKFEPLEINALVEEVITPFHNTITAGSISLRLDLHPDLARVKGERVHLQQVLMNLIMNAVEAMGESPLKTLTIRSTLRVSDNVVTVSVSDTGPGIDAANKDRVFESFFTTKKEGLGMGLRICKSILDEHKGRIWAENNPEGGATFFFSLKALNGEAA
jgi:two-component system sensor kinase FixL